MQIEPYLFFNGRCEEALTFYKTAIGAQVEMMMRYSENPDPQPQSAPGCGPAPAGDKIVHAAFKVGDSLVMASDGMGEGKTDFKGVSLSLTADDDAAAKRLFDALCDAGQAQMPLMETFYATSFGMLLDRFGVSWMVIAPKPM